MIADNLSEPLLAEVAEHIDLEAIQTLIDDTAVDFLPSMIEVFESEVVQRAEKIRVLLQDEQIAEVAANIKSLKGTLTTFGAHRAISLINILEIPVEVGDIETACAIATTLGEALELAVSSLKAISKEINA